MYLCFKWSFHVHIIYDQNIIPVKLGINETALKLLSELRVLLSYINFLFHYTLKHSYDQQY